MSTRRRPTFDTTTDPNAANRGPKLINGMLPDARDAVALGYDPSSIVRGPDSKIASARNAAGKVITFTDGVSPERQILDQQQGQSSTPNYASPAARALDRPTDASVALNPPTQPVPTTTSTPGTAAGTTGTMAGTGTPSAAPGAATTPDNSFSTPIKFDLASTAPTAGMFAGLPQPNAPSVSPSPSPASLSATITGRLPRLPDPVAPQVLAGTAAQSADTLRQLATTPSSTSTPVSARNAGGYLTPQGEQAAVAAGNPQRLPYGKISQSDVPTHIVGPGDNVIVNGKPVAPGAAVTFGPRGASIVPPSQPAPPPVATATPTPAAPVASGPAALPTFKGLPATSFPAIIDTGARPSPNAAINPSAAFNTSALALNTGTAGVSATPTAPDGYKAPTLPAIPAPMQPSDFAGPQTPAGQAIVAAGQPAPASSPQTASAAGLAARKTVGDALSSVGGALDQASAATGNAISNAADATTAFVTGSSKSATDGLSAYAPNTGEPSDMYASTTTAPSPAPATDAATQRLLNGDARGGMGTTTPAGGYNQATQDAQVDSTIALNNTGQRGTLPALPPPTVPAAAPAVATTAPPSFGASSTYVPPPSDADVSRAMNGGTAPTTSAADALSKAPGYGADPGTYSAAPASTNGNNALYQPTTQPAGNALYDPTAPKGNAVSQQPPTAGMFTGLPGTNGSGSATGNPPAPNPDDEEAKRSKQQAANDFIGI